MIRLLQTNVFAPALIGLLVATSATAQFTTPAGYLTTEGLTWQGVATYNGYAHVFGRNADMRYQQIDGEIKRAGSQVLTSVGFRPDYLSHSNNTAAGRRWTNVTLTLSDGDFATMSSTWSANHLTTPTMVFAGAVNWPTLSGTPSSKPAAWGAAYAFPFGTGGGTPTYMYTANFDLCLDYTFTGGTLANAAPWTGSTAKDYFLDGLYTLTSAVYGRNVYKYIGATTGNCRDSAHAIGHATGGIQVGMYGPLFTSNPAWTGKAVLQIFGDKTAPNSNVIHSIGLNGTVPGLPIPAFGCYNLMIDPSQVVIVFNIATNSAGSRSMLLVPIGDLSVLAPLGTVSIWSQAAWTDSATGQTMLTTGERCRPDFARKLNTRLPMKKAIYNHNPVAATGLGPFDQFQHNPLTRYN